MQFNTGAKTNGNGRTCFRRLWRRLQRWWSLAACCFKRCWGRLQRRCGFYCFLSNANGSVIDWDPAEMKTGLIRDPLPFLSFSGNIFFGRKLVSCRDGIGVDVVVLPCIFFFDCVLFSLFFFLGFLLCFSGWFLAFVWFFLFLIVDFCLSFIGIQTIASKGRTLIFHAMIWGERRGPWRSNLLQIFSLLNRDGEEHDCSTSHSSNGLHQERWRFQATRGQFQFDPRTLESLQLDP